jgi:hypothetical protein
MKRSLVVAAVLMLAVSALAVSPWGDDAACESKAQSTDQAIGIYRVTGGGQMSACMVDCVTVTGVDADCKIGFTAKLTGDPLPGGWHEAKGEIQLVDQTNGITFHGTVDEGQQPPFSDCVHFVGEDGTITTSSGTFDVTWFRLRINKYECANVFVDYDGSTAGWVLYDLERRKGNITFHEPKKGGPAPPPPGAPRVPNAISAGIRNTAAGSGWWGSGYEVYHSGSLSDMQESDDAYFTLVCSAHPIVDWSDCCPRPGLGMTLKWTGFEIPAGATEMKVRLEYHVYDPEDGTGQNSMPCDGKDWACCDVGGNGVHPNMCYAWYYPGPWPTGATVPNYGNGLVMLNFADALDWDGSGTGSPSAEIQDTPAEGGIGGEFAYNPTTDMAMEWTVGDWTNFVRVGPDGNEAAIHWCGGAINQLAIDKCTLEFGPH